MKKGRRKRERERERKRKQKVDGKKIPDRGRCETRVVWYYIPRIHGPGN
jgi:hypothetical protein